MRNKRLYNYKNKNIMYETRGNSILLELWLGKSEDYIFDILKEIGIECSFVIVRSSDSSVLTGTQEYSLECFCNEYKVLLKGSLKSTKENPKTINVIKEQVVKKYCYINGELEQEKNDVKDTIKETNKNLINYENKKTKKYLKEFFNNDREYEKKLLDILNSLGISRINQIDIHDLKLVKDFPLSVDEFSILCSCMDEDNTTLKLNIKKEKIGCSRTICISSDEKNIDFTYNVYTDELVHTQKVLKKVLK